MTVASTTASSTRPTTVAEGYNSESIVGCINTDIKVPELIALLEENKKLLVKSSESMMKHVSSMQKDNRELRSENKDLHAEVRESQKDIIELKKSLKAAQKKIRKIIRRNSALENALARVSDISEIMTPENEEEPNPEAGPISQKAGHRRRQSYSTPDAKTSRTVTPISSPVQQTRSKLQNSFHFSIETFKRRKSNVASASLIDRKRTIRLHHEDVPVESEPGHHDSGKNSNQLQDVSPLNSFTTATEDGQSTSTMEKLSKT
eukprot:CAMPEP_0184480310 /NCGR_PEP_ID=MMETSP0113_2-20130426/1800_1 /TAXON_ID=91329 /ORGANISM="Norrisiella sphaerica, Strain BC52" /LENGTH=261 /DNA_ID=CAMNT_0026858697 /DNA_START=416 /DNA_END=1201 /DNA_ORIENTATION=+